MSLACKLCQSDNVIKWGTYKGVQEPTQIGRKPKYVRASSRDMGRGLLR